MLKIRLKRLGAKKSPTYRIIVINSTTKREGKPIQELGHYNPKTKIMKLDVATANDWVKKGAQPTDTVKYLIDNANKDGSLNYKKKAETKLSKKAKAKIEAEKSAAAEAKDAAKAAAQTAAASEAAAVEETAKQEENAQAAMAIMTEEATICPPEAEVEPAAVEETAVVEEPAAAEPAVEETAAETEETPAEKA